jgi:hypothetical protein
VEPDQPCTRVCRSIPSHVLDGRGIVVWRAKSRKCEAMANSETILTWLKEARAYAYQLEQPDRPSDSILVDVLVGASTVGVHVRRGGQQHYQCLTWSEIECAKNNPMLQLIDETIAGKER